MAKTANTEKDTTKRQTINSVVSHEFKEAFDAWAEEKKWSTAAALRYLVEQAVGMNTAPPDTGADTDRYILSTAVDPPVREAIEKIENGAHAGKVAAFIRQVAANACGYDLSLEPERVSRGGAGELLKKEQEKTQSQNAVLLGLRKYMTPDQFVAAIADAGKTAADIGLSDEDLTEAAFAALR